MVAEGMTTVPGTHDTLPSMGTALGRRTWPVYSLGSVRLVWEESGLRQAVGLGEGQSKGGLGRRLTEALVH